MIYKSNIKFIVINIISINGKLVNSRSEYWEGGTHGLSGIIFLFR